MLGFTRANASPVRAQLVPDANHWLFTIGSENSYALRAARGSLSRHGVWHANWPCVFLIVRGRRWPR